MCWSHFCIHVCTGIPSAWWFMCWFWRCINCLFVCLLDFFSHFFFFTFFFPYAFSLSTSLLLYFLTYLSTFFRIDPFHFQAGGRRKRPNVALFLGLFYVVVYFVTDACLLMLCLFQFFSTKPRDWLGRMSPKWPI